MTPQEGFKRTRCSGTVRFRVLALAIVAAWSLGCSDERGPKAGEAFVIVRSGRLATNIDLGVNTATEQHEWVTAEPQDDPREIVMRFPAGQRYGFVTFLLGVEAERAEYRYHDDFSGFEAMFVRMRGQWQPGEVALTNRSIEDPDAEKQARCELRPDPQRGADEYVEFTVPLVTFDAEGDESRRAALFAPAQFLFTGQKYTTVAVSDIKLLPPTSAPTACPATCDCDPP